MARVVAPLLSFSGSGQIGSAQVYAEWKGRPYVRRYVIPSNPNTAEQQLTRNTFAWLNAVWRYMPAAATSAWDLYAEGFRITGRNAFIKVNNGPLREASDLTNFVMSPSARSGIVAASMTLTPGDDQITVDLTAPSLPTGWTISKAIAAAIRQQDPQTGALYQVVAGEDATSAYQIILSGLASAAEYVVGGWFEFTKPDGSLAYGQSIQATETTT